MEALSDQINQIFRGDEADGIRSRGASLRGVVGRRQRAQLTKKSMREAKVYGP
jgi:hypothetical protein